MFEKIIIIKINDGFINLIGKTRNEKEIANNTIFADFSLRISFHTHEVFFI